MHEGPDSVYLSDKPIDAMASDGPQGIQATEQKSRHRPKMFDDTDGGRSSRAGVFTGRAGRSPHPTRCHDAPSAPLDRLASAPRVLLGVRAAASGSGSAPPRAGRGPRRRERVGVRANGRRFPRRLVVAIGQ